MKKSHGDHPHGDTFDGSERILRRPKRILGFEYNIRKFVY